jgi:hypothetical protein
MGKVLSSRIAMDASILYMLGCCQTVWLCDDRACEKRANRGIGAIPALPRARERRSLYHPNRPPPIGLIYLHYRKVWGAATGSFRAGSPIISPYASPNRLATIDLMRSYVTEQCNNAKARCTLIDRSLGALAIEQLLTRGRTMGCCRHR